MEKKSYLEKLDNVVEKDFYEPLNMSQISNRSHLDKGNKAKYGKECSACREKFYQS